MSCLQSVCCLEVLLGNSNEIVLFSLIQLHVLAKLVTTSFELKMLISVDYLNCAFVLN